MDTKTTATYAEDFIRVQVYTLYLINGETLEVSEKYDLPEEKRLVYRFARSEENEIFVVPVNLAGVFYIPRRSIVAIYEGRVEKIDKGAEELRHLGEEEKNV